MPIYVYKAINPEGRESTREMAASSEEALKQELGKQGLMLKRVREKKGTPFSWAWGGAAVDPQVFLQCNQEMITLLNAGLTVPEALDLSADRPESPALSTILKKVLRDVRSGDLFSAACSKHPQVFDGLYLSSLRTGEKTGNLARPLERYQQYLQRRVALQQKVSQALVYPFFLLAVLVAVMALLFVFVMPRFAALYGDFHAALPLATRFLMTLVRHLAMVAFVGVGVCVGSWALFKTWTHGGKGRRWWDEAKYNWPLLQGFHRPFLVSQWTRTLSTLLTGGTPLTEALRVSRDSLANLAYAARVDRVIRRVLEGEGLSQAVGQEGLAPRSAVKLIEVGEVSGRLEGMLEEITASAERVLEARIQRMMVLVEPVFILLAGLLIGSVIVVMYLPIIHMTDIVK